MPSNTRSQVTQESLDAYDHMVETGKLGDEQRFVYKKLDKYGPCTGKELHKKLVIDEDNRQSKLKGPERVRKRLPDLAKKDLVVRKEKRECDVSEQKATVWDTVDPVKTKDQDSKETTVVNMHHQSCDVRIDRKTRFGNPFKLDEDGGSYTREESIDKYRDWFKDKIENDEQFKEAVHELKGKTLGCWCKPQPCHGDVIADYLNNLGGDNDD